MQNIYNFVSIFYCLFFDGVKLVLFEGFGRLGLYEEKSNLQLGLKFCIVLIRCILWIVNDVVELYGFFMQFVLIFSI